MMPAVRPVFNVQTLRWAEDCLELLDQRILPARTEYVRCHTAVDVANAIRSMVVRGAPAIGCAAAYGMALAARELERSAREYFAIGMESAFASLAASRPTAVNLAWALERMRAAWARVQKRESREIGMTLLLEAQAIALEDIRTNQAMGAHGAMLLRDGDRVLTHCNAGALATAGHGTALGVVRSAVAQGKTIFVIANETRPFLQGARLTAWEMVQEHIPVTLITDGMSGHLMNQGRVDAVIVGADRIAANGDVANKIGTYMVAVLARRHAIPFYVAAPLSTIDRNCPTGAAIPIEERTADEVTGHGGVRWAPEGVQVVNPAFDVTPAELVSALITEAGVVREPDAGRIAGLFAAA